MEKTELGSYLEPTAASSEPSESAQARGPFSRPLLVQLDSGPRFADRRDPTNELALSSSLQIIKLASRPIGSLSQLW
jgi:hypothetical protein